MSIEDEKYNYQLPNGQWIKQINSYETDFVFNEIFIEEVYIRHNINIPDNAVIFDVGANIGLFSLYVKQKSPSSKIYAFEPSPKIYPFLKHNTSSFGESVKVYNLGLSDEEKKSQFFYYPGYSVISGFHANKKRDTDIIISGMKAASNEPDYKIESLVKSRMEKVEDFQCGMTTVTKIIQDNKIEKLDLLKIDVEGAELSVLKGIKMSHWQRIQQIVMEVHSKELLKLVINLLKDKYFNVSFELDKNLKDSEIYNLFAYR